MELVKKNLQILRGKSRAVNQITFDEDFNVPDIKPDISRMIQKKGEVKIEEVQVNEGKAKVRGTLQFHLLYVADTPQRQISSLEGKIPIEETIFLQGVESGDKICLHWEIEDLTLYAINSRKLNVKAIVGFRANVDEAATLQIPVSWKGMEEISEKRKKIRVLTLGVHKKDTLRKKEELQIPSNKPNIHELLWDDVELRSMEYRADDGKIHVKGELFIFVLYSGEDDKNSPQWMEQILPFSEEISCMGSESDMIPYMDASILQANLEIKPDTDGEQRMIQVDVLLEVDMKLYKEGTEMLLQDVYTPQKECVLERKEETMEQLLVKNDAKCRVQDKVSVQEAQGKVLQICHSEGKVTLEDVKIVKNGLQADGVIHIRILYSVIDDEMPFYSVDTTVPFSHVIESEDIGKNCVYHLQAALEQLSTMMLDSNEIEVKAIVGLNALVVRQWKEQIITSIQARELDWEKIEKMPGIVCYIVQPQDSLWDIAKKFYTTVESIREMNDLGEDEVRPQQSLLVVKKADEM